MRWLFLILLLLNGVLFGWFYQEQQARSQIAERRAQVGPELASLTLLEEAAPEQLHERPSLVLDRPPAPAPVPATVTEPVAAIQGESYCHRIGPFSSEAQARGVVDGVDYQPGQSQVVPGRVPLEPEYWVYVERPTTDADRRAVRRELKIDGLESYWIRRGELKGQLSLGLYRNRQSADALLSALLNKGYDANLYKKPRFDTAYFIEIETQNGEFPSAEWRRALARNHPDIKSEKKSCSGLATGKIPE